MLNICSAPLHTAAAGKALDQHWLITGLVWSDETVNALLVVCGVSGAGGRGGGAWHLYNKLNPWP